MSFKLTFLVLLVSCVAVAAPDKYNLVYTENFNGKKLNEKLWSRIDQGAPDWRKNMSTRPDLVELKDGIFLAYGKKNEDRARDSRSCLTGGISSQKKFALLYGKVEIKCKLHGQKGAWPAIWMMPDKGDKPWPKGGEIDIVERLNFDSFVYQTVHSAWTQGHPNDPPKGGRAPIQADDWNIYGLEWTPEKLVWTVNGKPTHQYAKVGEDPARYPWTEPFYLMIDMQLGGNWVGPINEATLPTQMEVDWVKFYTLVRDGKTLGGIFRDGRKLRGKKSKR